MRPISNIRKRRERRRSLINLFDRPVKKFRILWVNFLIKSFKYFCRITLFSKITSRQAYSLKLTEHEIYFDLLPESFEGYSILFLSDLHIDMVLDIESKIFDIIDKTDFHACLLGGDYAYRYKGKNINITKEFADRLIKKIHSKDKAIYGALGNHDIYEFGCFLEEKGVKMLVNESVKIAKEDSHIYIAAIDDADYYKSHDFALCEEGIEHKESFKIIISHTPDIYKEAEKFGYHLALCGHTHGGQVCLPGGFPIFTSSKAPRKYARGKWKHKNLHGITSNGIGCSAFAARLFCPPEIILIKLKKTRV
ncbi:MAG TPA: metallophosphoesterase [Lentisphaeria bacterium]|nr:MAG: hypothetical protein A2X47_07055 [Lentisphaerae bacterium GWF2_38_69]HBM15610.1 metallophosphoesterase [Lentisphaeria bacterium]